MFRIFFTLAALLGISVSVAGPKPLAQPKPVAIVVGYPAPDAPLYEFAFRRQHARVDSFEATWLPTADYAKYAVVVLTGNLARAQVKPATYTDDDLKTVAQFLENGGTLILTSGSLDIFHSPNGGTFIDNLLGKSTDAKDKTVKLLEPKQRWVSHLADEKDLSWLTDVTVPYSAGKAERIIGTDGGRASLAQLTVGRGQIIYIGWQFSHFIPGGRNLNSTVEDEQRYESQYKILSNIARDLYPPERN